MATITGNLRTILLANEDVTDIIGQRLYVLAFPADPTLPCMVYRDISGAYTLQVAQESEADMRTRLQFDVWAETYAETQEMKEVLVPFFTGYRNKTYGILDTNIDLTFSVRDPDTGLYRYVMDVSIVHNGA